METELLVGKEKVEKSNEKNVYNLSLCFFVLASIVLTIVFFEEYKKIFNSKNVAIIAFIVSGGFVIFSKIKLYFKENNKECDLYDITEAKAKKIKILIQMAIGIGIAFLIVIEILSLMYPEIKNIVPSGIVKLIKMDILKMVSLGLGAATGIELAYMLFTDGPDEAVDPLIMGIASFVLAQLSDTNFEIQKGIGIFFIVILIPILFVVKNKFLTEEKKKLLKK